MPYADPADHLAQTERWRKANPDKINAMSKRYRQQEDQKPRVNARNRLRTAVSGGVVIKQPCEMCGDPRSEGHHPWGYVGRLALEVWWLCRHHHRGLHAAMKGA